MHIPQHCPIDTKIGKHIDPSHESRVPQMKQPKHAASHRHDQHAPKQRHAQAATIPRVPQQTTHGSTTEPCTTYVPTTHTGDRSDVAGAPRTARAGVRGTKTHPNQNSPKNYRHVDASHENHPHPRKSSKGVRTTIHCPGTPQKPPLATVCAGQLGPPAFPEAHKDPQNVPETPFNAKMYTRIIQYLCAPPDSTGSH